MATSSSISTTLLGYIKTNKISVSLIPIKFSDNTYGVTITCTDTSSGRSVSAAYLGSDTTVSSTVGKYVENIAQMCNKSTVSSTASTEIGTTLLGYIKNSHVSVSLLPAKDSAGSTGIMIVGSDIDTNATLSRLYKSTETTTASTVGGYVDSIASVVRNIT